MGRNSWTTAFTHNPVDPLAGAGDPAIAYIAGRDFLAKHPGDVNFLQQQPLAVSLARRQQADGSWKYPGGNTKLRSQENYDQLETFRNLAYLVQMFEFDQSNAVVERAVDFLLRFQTAEGDIRGILGDQYTPYYTAAMLELFVKAGYSDDPRVLRAFQWLGSIRQDDGGWAIPLRTRGKALEAITQDIPPLSPDRSKPFSHMVTGIVLRAYAAHPTYRHAPEATDAGKLLLTRFFKKDAYTDRADASFWTRFSYPFWFTDLISAMDSLSLLGFSRDEPAMRQALDWFIDHQGSDGLWRLKTLKNEKKFHTNLWISLAICRIYQRLYA
ncbi:MAG TPA: hypothetical protein VIR03_00240 [Candidatus Saccharimonadales bacterium]